MSPTAESPHALAFRYGTDLPRAPTLRPEPPGFAVGSVSRMTFSPDGRHLVVPTANGTFLWDVDARAKRMKLAVPSNPTHFTFTDDGCELLVRNEQGEFARIAIPSGEVVARFKSRHRFRLDGAGCLGPGNTHVLQLAYGGRLLALDATNGKVLLEHALDPTGCDGQVHWIAATGEIVVAQSSVSDASNRNLPCALWRWRWPLEAGLPERQPGRWELLASRFLPGPGLLLLHHVPDRKTAPGRWALDILDVRTFQPLRRLDCTGDGVGGPSLAHDQAAWSASRYQHVEVVMPGGVVDFPISVGSAEFSPVADLVAVSGQAGFVAPRAQLATLRAAVQTQSDFEALNLRGYSRMTTLPGRALPPRLVVYAGAAGWLFEPEVVDVRRYAPQRETRLLAPGAESAQVVAALADAIERARRPLATDAARGGRDFLVGKVLPPPGEWDRAVAVSLADDAIDLWPLKRKADGTFVQHWSPVAAVEPGTQGAALWRAIEAMLGGKGKGKRK